MPRLRMSGAIPPFPLYAFRMCTGINLPFIYFYKVYESDE
jgi:hypothetical protein